jgi:hypothetical protein
MTVLRGVQGAEDEPLGLVAVPRTSSFGALVEEKASDLLGLTGEEFKRRWYAGAYLNNSQPEVVALDTLMRTGAWPSVS